MLSKSFISFIFLLASISSVNAHAGVNPALGVNGQMTRSDVQRPSAKAPCGNVNVAQTVGGSTAVPADASGNFSPNITNFNGGTDGSRSIKQVQVDASATGNNFVAAKMVVNGNGDPTSDGTEQLTAQLPPGTKCTGGATGNLCLASFTTTAGFGNCVVVSQGAGASKAPAPRSASGQSDVARNGAAKGVTRSTDSRAAADDEASQNGQVDKSKDKKKKKGNGKKKGDKKKNGKGDKKAVAGSTDSRAASSDQKNQTGQADKSKTDNKKKDNGKKKGDKKGKDGKKGGKKSGKQADKTAPGAPAASDGNKPKRSWSSRQMGKLA